MKHAMLILLSLGFVVYSASAQIAEKAEDIMPKLPTDNIYVKLHDALLKFTGKYEDAIIHSTINNGSR